MRRVGLLGAAAALFVAPLAQAAPMIAAQADHSLQYEAREATWSHLALSPDGQWLWFDLLGDIYRMPAQGGAAQPVLTGSAWERNPVVSPDGRQVAFLSDRSGVTNLWVARIDGSQARQLTHDASLVIYSSPEWAPDGQSLTVSRAVHQVLAFELWRVPLSGEAPNLLVAAQPKGDEGWDERINAMGAVPSPDGKALIYATRTGHIWTDADAPNWSIVRRDNGSGAIETLIPGGMRPALSPDGRWLAYAARRAGGDTGLRLRDLETGVDRWLTVPVDHDAQEGAWYYDLLPRYQFTPDGKALVMSVDGHFARLDLASGARRPIPFTAPVSLALRPQSRVVQKVAEGPVVTHLAEGTSLSPDGKTLAFTALGRLYVAPRAGSSAPRLLFDGDAFQPVWAEQGRSLVFVRWNQDGGGLWQASSNGGAPRRLSAREGYWREPLVDRRDGAVVALLSSHYDRLVRRDELAPAGPTDVVRVGADGSVKVLAHGQALRGLQQTADGRLFVQTAEGLAQIMPDGTLAAMAAVVARPMGQYVKGQRPVDELRISPDGQWLAARTAYELTLVPLSLVTPAAKAQRIDLAAPPPGTRLLTRIGADTMRWDAAGLGWTLGHTWRHAAVLAPDRTGLAEEGAEQRSLAVSLPRAMPAHPRLLRGATVLTMERGSAPLTGADLLIVGDRIAGLGPQGSLKLPRGTVIEDVSGKFIVPGLIDAHAHFFGLRRPISDARHWEFHALLAYGVTSALEVQAFTPDIFAYADRMDTGQAVGPRLFSTGPGVFVNSAITSVEAARDVLTRYRDGYGTRNIKSYMVGDRAARQAMAEASRQLGMMPTTEGAADFVVDLTHAVDGFAGNEHNLPITPLHEDIVRLYAASGIAYDPTLTVLYGGVPVLQSAIESERPEEEARLKAFMPPEVLASKLSNRRWSPAERLTAARFAADAMRIAHAGGLVGIGSHGEMQGIGLHWEMAAMVAGGASPLEALAMATRDNAVIIGRPDDLGTVTVGKLADLLVLDADPRSDIAHVRSIARVLRGGIGYDPLTLQRDEGTRLPRSWWQDDAGDILAGK